MNGTSDSYDVIIAGAGPAGSSAAIHLAMAGVRVLLVEQKKFPRAKLCGEFISPECLKHFESLGVIDSMLAAGGVALHRTVFYARSGRSVDVPSSWFDTQRSALGLSRAEMDQQLLARARQSGVTVLEETQATGLLSDAGRVHGLEIKSPGGSGEVTASLVIDATGRTRALEHHLGAVNLGRTAGARTRRRASLVAFKAHLRNASTLPGTCEIYFYPGGYGGLSGVENGLSNLCFIVAAKDVRACQADPARAMRELVTKNSRAAQSLAEAQVEGQWLAVALGEFGRREPTPAPGLLTIGDAAAFIDPFTGSGMLMALEGGALAASVILRHLPDLQPGDLYNSLEADYTHRYWQQFGSRLRVCALLRRAAFIPALADVAIALLGASERARRALARRTRQGRSDLELGAR